MPINLHFDLVILINQKDRGSFHKNKRVQLKSFIDRKTEYSIPCTDFFKYLQIWNAVSSIIKENMLGFGVSEVEKIISSILIQGKMSDLYDTLSKGGLSSFQPLLKIWEKI